MRRRDTRLLQEMREGFTIKRMQKTVANRFSESSKVMQHDLRVGLEFVLVRSAEVMAVENRKIRGGVEGGEDEASLRMKDTKKFTNHGDGGGDKWK